jgi:hypothetical protein
VIPVSTISSESAFSLGGRILGDNRSSMTLQTLKALVCGKDWLYKYPSNQGYFHYLIFNQILHLHRSDMVISVYVKSSTWLGCYEKSKWLLKVKVHL